MTLQELHADPARLAEYLGWPQAEPSWQGYWHNRRSLCDEETPLEKFQRWWRAYLDDLNKSAIRQVPARLALRTWKAFIAECRRKEKAFVTQLEEEREDDSHCPASAAGADVRCS